MVEGFHMHCHWNFVNTVSIMFILWMCCVTVNVSFLGLSFKS